MKKIVFIVFLFIQWKICVADVLSITGKVTKVVTFSKSYESYSESQSGLTGIYIEGMPKACGNGNTRALIGVGHPVHDVALSIALTAYATGKKVKLAYINECTQRSNGWDFAYIQFEE